MNWTRVKNSAVLSIFLFILLVAVGYGAFNMARQAWLVGGEARATTKKIEELRQRKAALESYLAELQTREAAEREAKNRLGLKLPGEKVVVVVEERAAVSPADTPSNLWERIRAFFKKVIP